MVGSSSAGDAADFVTNRFLYSSIISFTSSSGTFSLLFIICTNLLSDIRPVFWGSKDLHRENNFLHVYFAKRGKYVWRYHVSIYPIFVQHMLNICVFAYYRKMSSKHSSSGSSFLCREISVRYSLKETENPYRSADTFLINALAWNEKAFVGEQSGESTITSNKPSRSLKLHNHGKGPY